MGWERREYEPLRLPVVWTAPNPAAQQVLSVSPGHHAMMQPLPEAAAVAIAESPVLVAHGQKRCGVRYDGNSLYAHNNRPVSISRG